MGVAAANLGGADLRAPVFFQPNGNLNTRSVTVSSGGKVGRTSTSVYVGGVFGALGGRLSFPVHDVFGGVFGALGGRLPFPA